jgi:hypothetical protein
MLPIPKNPNFRAPEVSDEEFYNPTRGEDEPLIATGAFDEDMSRAELMQSALNEVRALKEKLKK